MELDNPKPEVQDNQIWTIQEINHFSTLLLKSFHAIERGDKYSAQGILNDLYKLVNGKSILE